MSKCVSRPRLATLYCRRDLWLKMMVSGGLFPGIYFLVFTLFNVVFPGYIGAVWNLKAISCVRFMGVSLEELMFAFTFGLYWSTVYEHLTWHLHRAVWERGNRFEGVWPGPAPAGQKYTLS